MFTYDQLGVPRHYQPEVNHVQTRIAHNGDMSTLPDVERRTEYNGQIEHYIKPEDRILWQPAPPIYQGPGWYPPPVPPYNASGGPIFTQLCQPQMHEMYHPQTYQPVW